ncbi:MAG: beta-propeller domain-containing protein [Oscillospiraceae bacterium]|nr:beta-propeller domain-containing protein [Oscillospiraceae bacterium]
MKKSVFFRLAVLVLAFCFAAALFGGCRRIEKTEQKTEQTAQTEPDKKDETGKTGASSQSGEKQGTSQSSSPAAAPSQTAAGENEPPKAEIKELAVTSPASYKELYKALTAENESGGRMSANGSKGMDMGTDAVEVEEEAAGEAMGNGEEMGAGGADEEDYSGTNVQVEGVDEADIVKTDGKYIYVLTYQQDLVILEANGAETRQLSSLRVASGYDAEDDYSKGSSNYAQEMYVSDGRVIIIRTGYEWGYEGDRYYSSETTMAHVYDVSDPENPEFIGRAGQDGYYSDSRMYEGRLYLVSNHYVYRYYDIDESEPGTYVPYIYRNGEKTMMPIDCISIIGEDSSSYAIISVIDPQNADIEASETLLCNVGSIYMSGESIYITSSRYDEEASDEYMADQYTVTDYTERRVTDIVRINTANGLDISGTTTVPGYLVNQFAMDEYNGCFRLVTTVDDYSYSVYEDKKYEFTNWKYNEGETYNCLYVLDGGLNIIGSVTDLAEDEYVRSVRFSGDIAYFVTFRQVDPLFAVDLSEPANPKVLSALKIPGFSEYLHIYSDGRLFGLGQDVDEETGWTNCMKMTMFDVSDPADVTEITTKLLEDDYWSVALYNHKAVLISAEKDIIAFPGDDSFYVFGYSDERGFYEKGEFNAYNDMYSARSLYIGDYMYICGQDLTEVVNMESFEVIAEVWYAYG